MTKTWWLHTGCGGRVFWDLSGGFCTTCETDGLEPGDCQQEGMS